MSIAVDQSRLRRIVDTLLAGERLDRAEVVTLLEIAQLAAGVDAADDPQTHAILQAVAQQVSSRIGLELGDLRPVPSIPDVDHRAVWLGTLARQLDTRAARELAFALVFLLSIADLRLSPEETAALEEFQRALGLDDRRATDLVVFLSDSVAADERVA